MNVQKAALRLYAFLALCPILLAQASIKDSPVTETKRVENYIKAGGGTVLLRKINGRWWTPDNIQVNPPGKGGFFWTLVSDPGVVQFLHHRPFDLTRAESLHLWMTEDQVEAVLGQPNSIFGKSPHAFWSYFAADGTELSVRFMGDGLGEAKYNKTGETSRPVASVESDLGGRDIYKLGAERAWKKVQEADEQRKQQFQADHPPPTAPNSRTIQPHGNIVPPPAAAHLTPEAPTAKRIVPSDALAAIVPGATREDVLSKLGDPAFRSTITSDDGTRETFTYYGESGEVILKLVNGKVTSVR